MHGLTRAVDFALSAKSRAARGVKILARQARETGFDLLGYSDQHHFLVGAAEPWLHTLGDFTAQSDAARNDLRALQTLLNPASMGIQFKAIGLGKNFPNGHPLSCFKYQRPGIEAL